MELICCGKPLNSDNMRVDLSVDRYEGVDIGIFVKCEICGVEHNVCSTYKSISEDLEYLGYNNQALIGDNR